MNFEPFTPLERSEPLPPSAPVADAPNATSAHYFDRAGCVWIVACVLLAGMAGRMLPSLVEPGGVRQALAALAALDSGSESADAAKANPATTVADLPPHSANPNEVARGVQVKQEIGPRLPAMLRQF
nr:hypothetical protein [uncultured Albidiferax sp.]